MSLFFVSHETCRLHRAPSSHPECPERLQAIEQALDASPLGRRVIRLEARPVTREQLERVHAPEYLDLVEASVPPPGQWDMLDTGDTYLCEHSLEAARLAAGAVVTAVDRVMGTPGSTAFCSVRPPGHHAGRRFGMGFCLFNNVAVGAAHAMAIHGLTRVAIVDFDVHHGNGTEDIFRHEPRVLLCSSFQHPLYPGTGADTRSDHILNLPLHAGTDGPALRSAMKARWLPVLEDFAPQLVMVSAGFDAHVDDPLASFRLVEADYVELTEMIMDLARRYGRGRVVSVLEGGYDLPALGRSVLAHLQVLADADGELV
ncbi:histone deacetylase superfamily protein [Ectothiorhodospira sp. PHS-1]|uniref:histone deacetylase family protein n=1 Tax=Ectothiorhodospira sp. PHS-1 TaxID=519989 RepID=UPI00024A872D|nr:histone deacetylase family protein [Ectothiorhodospira sp. PHS-1]EHQ53526.1 histone deacetylase superfamily protein [Ectothiorhodospira sp. PHS-1]